MNYLNLNKRNRRIAGLFLAFLMCFFISSYVSAEEPLQLLNFWGNFDVSTQEGSLMNKTPSILFVGNSLTFYNDTQEMVRQFAVENGYQPQIDTVFASGYTLKSFSNPEKKYGSLLYEKLSSRSWDYVVLQEKRGKAITDPGETNDAIAVLKPLIDQAGAKMVLFMTWSPTLDDVQFASGTAISSSREEYQTKVSNMYFSLSETFDAFLSPTGIAFMRAADLYPDTQLIKSDGHHPTVLGSYLSACCMYATIFGNSPVGNSYSPGNYDKNNLRRLQKLAEDLVIIKKPVFATSVSMKETVSMGIGEEHTLKVNMIPSNSTDLVFFESADYRIATVSDSGVVTAVKPGNVDIIAKSSSGVQYVTKVNVKHPKVTLGVGESYQLDKTTAALGYQSLDPSIATISKDGGITGRKKGKVTLSATCANGGTATCLVYVKKAPGKILLKSTQINMEKGKTYPLKPTLQSGYTAEGFRFVSSNPKIISVSGDGVMKALKKGTATITITTYNGKKLECNVKSWVRATKISVTNVKSRIKLRVGDIQKIKVKMAPSNVSRQQKKWKSSNKKVIRVISTSMSSAKIKAVGKGTATLKITTTDGSKKSCTVKIRVRS